jgi:hypothetical protein
MRRCKTVGHKQYDDDDKRKVCESGVVVSTSQLTEPAAAKVNPILKSDDPPMSGHECLCYILVCCGYLIPKLFLAVMTSSLPKIPRTIYMTPINKGVDDAIANATHLKVQALA